MPSAALACQGTTGIGWLCGSSPMPLGALRRNYVLFRDRPVPCWISGWGLLAATSLRSARLLMIGGIALGPTTVTAFDAPIFAQEMVFPCRLIVRGLSAAS